MAFGALVVEVASRDAGAPAELIVTHRGLGYAIDPRLL